VMLGVRSDDDSFTFRRERVVAEEHESEESNSFISTGGDTEPKHAGGKKMKPGLTPPPEPERGFYQKKWLGRLLTPSIKRSRAEKR